MRALLLCALMLSACAAPSEPTIPEGASPAADALIEHAGSPEEKKELTALRDEVDAEKRAEAAALDAEIARLERENAELRRRR